MPTLVIDCRPSLEHNLASSSMNVLGGPSTTALISDKQVYTYHLLPVASKLPTSCLQGMSVAHLQFQLCHMSCRYSAV